MEQASAAKKHLLECCRETAVELEKPWVSRGRHSGETVRPHSESWLPDCRLCDGVNGLHDAAAAVAAIS